MHKKTQFEIRIYQIVKSIPKGKTLSYKTIAKMAGRPRACPPKFCKAKLRRAWRAVGNILNKSANRRTKIPCHRVIKSDGRVGGFRKGEKRKIALLQKEGIIIKNGKTAFRLTR